DLRLDLANATLDVFLGASAINDGGGFLGDFNALGSAEHVEGHVFELDAEVFRDDLTAGQDRDVFQHCLTTIAKAWSLNSCNLEAATQTVHNEGRKSFPFDVFCNDQQWTLGLNN